MACPSLTPSSLGFQKAKCCKIPCPNFPAVRVNICVQVNQTSKVIIQQGCKLPEEEVALQPCRVDWKTGYVATSWGDKFRRVTYSYWVPAETMIRIRVCPNTETGCSDGGDCPVPYDAEGQFIHNRILRFEINGVDYASMLNTTSIEGGAEGCLFIGCQDYIPGIASAEPTYPLTTTCCHYATAPQNSDAVPILKYQDAHDFLPWGAEIVVGPVGTPLPFA